MRVILFCTGRGTHAPVVVYGCDVPLPGWWREKTPSTVWELLCCKAAERGERPCPDRRHDCGGCGYSPRPSDAALRTLIEAIAETPSRTFDISYWDL